MSKKTRIDLVYGADYTALYVNGKLEVSSSSLGIEHFVAALRHHKLMSQFSFGSRALAEASDDTVAEYGDYPEDMDELEFLEDS
jgi:hypothetical protein